MSVRVELIAAQLRRMHPRGGPDFDRLYGRRPRPTAGGVDG